MAGVTPVWTGVFQPGLDVSERRGAIPARSILREPFAVATAALLLVRVLPRTTSTEHRTPCPHV